MLNNVVLSVEYAPLVAFNSEYTGRPTRIIMGRAHHLSLNREGRWGTTWFCNQFSPFFPCFPLPSGTLRTPGLSIPDVVFPPVPLSALSSSHFHCAVCKMVLARPDEREAWPYHCSLRLFMMVRRSSCGPIACWILARTSSLWTWSLYEMCSVLR